MHVISKKRLREFWERHPVSEEVLRRWFKVVDKAHWERWPDLKATFPRADLVTVASGTRMAVFDVGGNDYRVVARVLFGFGRVYVRSVMTHAEYSKDRWKEAL